MNMQLLIQQLIGVINLSFPLIIIYQINSAFMQQWYGQLFCAVLIGAYVYYLTTAQTKNMANSLIFEPSTQSKEAYQKIITECGMNPDVVNLRYGYSNHLVAMTIANTVTIDPLYFADVSHDPEMVKVKDILEQHIVPGLSQSKKKCIEQTKEIYSPGVQRFIFKHELAHVQDQFSSKKAIVIGIIGALSALVGIMITMKMLASAGGLMALAVGMLVGTTTDLVLSNLSNVVFTLSQEKRADIFAAKNSSKEDILDAAQFFEKLQLIVDADKKHEGLLSRIPSEILTGHPRGSARAAYLRELSQQ